MRAAIGQPASEIEPTGAAPGLNVIVIASQKNSFAHNLLNELHRLQPAWSYCFRDHTSSPSPELENGLKASCIYLPLLTPHDGLTPDLREAKQTFERAASYRGRQFILLSSALIYGAGPARQALVSEEYSSSRNSTNRISGQWNGLETMAIKHLQESAILTILRPAIVLPSPTLFSQMLSRRVVSTLPGHDPALQFLSISDLSAAMLCAMERNKAGIFNIAPDGVVPLHSAIRIAGSIRAPIPRTLRRAITGSNALDFLRYSWTISNTKIKEELGFVPRKSSAAALLEFRCRNHHCSRPEPQFDEFGMDQDYIRFYSRSLFKFLSDYYWRIENRGLEHIPRQGRGVLVGMHRGFMPFDGVMAMHLIVQKTGRVPRFLTHPGLLKFPFLANFMTKLGGVVACQESAEWVLKSDELLGIFPEGIHGAFTPYRQVYKLQAFGRDAFVKLALRYRAPIVPFVTVGSAEIFPIFGKIKSRRWTHYTDWPFVPITPTFPLVPVPLPSKWHTQFLPPISTDEYPPQAAEDRSIVREISREVRMRMQQAVDEMLSRRRSIFFGSIFRPERS